MFDATTRTQLECRTLDYDFDVTAVGAQHAVQDIALVEMAGDRIAQIRDYASRDDLEPRQCKVS